jgi:hypothetical protein
MKSLTQLELFDKMDKSTDLKKKLAVVGVSTDGVKTEQLEDGLRLIQRRVNLQMKNRVLDDIQKGRVVPLYNPERLSVSTAVPAFLKLDPRTNKPIAMVNLTNYASTPKGQNVLSIDNRTLYTLLQWGTILLGCHENQVKVTSSVPLMKAGAAVYVRLAAGVLDRLYGISLSPIRHDIVCYLLARFFLANHMGLPHDRETVLAIARGCAPNRTSVSSLQGSADDLIRPESWVSLTSFLADLSKVEGLGSMTVRAVLEGWIKTYGESSVFGMEHFPSMAASIFGAHAGGRVGRDYSLEQATGRDGTDLYVELARALGQ